jgi:hypothetical protein
MKQINRGFKGAVYDSRVLIDELKDIDYAVLISIDYNGNIKKNIVKVSNFINIIDTSLLVKKFISSNIIIGETKDNFNNELNGYKKMIKILGKKVYKYTTIREGFIYKGRKIYGINFENNYYVFLEKCNKTIDEVKFTQKSFNRFSKMIMNTLKIMEKNNYLHNDIKPSNIICCYGNNGIDNFKLIDWELSFSLSKQVNGFYLNKNGNVLYNHPIKFYYTGIPLLVNKLIFSIELLFDKDIRKLKTPIKIREIIEESFNYLNKNKFFYFKYSDYFAFALVHIYIAEKNNLKISLNLIKPILQLFNIKLI